MQKAFVLAPSGFEIARRCAPDVKQVKKIIRERTAIVVTQESTGEALLVAGKIITSLFLVRNYTRFKVILPKQGINQAVLKRKDEQNNLAELQLVGLTSQPKLDSIAYQNVRVASPGGIGDPLLVPSVASSGSLKVRVAGMGYVINMCPNKEDRWNIEQRLPYGMAGGGIWNLRGQFTGLTIAQKQMLSGADVEMVLALPVEVILNFAETN